MLPARQSFKEEVEYVFQEIKQPVRTIYKERFQSLDTSYLKVIPSVSFGKGISSLAER